MQLVTRFHCVKTQVSPAISDLYADKINAPTLSKITCHGDHEEVF